MTFYRYVILKYIMSVSAFIDQVQLEYTTQGGSTLIQVMNSLGQVIAVPLDQVHQKGTYTISLNLSHLASGTYYIRLQNQTLQHVKSLIKV